MNSEMDSSQRFVISDTKSSWTMIPRGVLRSVLEPTLFNLFINDLNDGAEAPLAYLKMI